MVGLFQILVTFRNFISEQIIGSFHFRTIFHKKLTMMTPDTRGFFFFNSIRIKTHLTTLTGISRNI